ncbi:MAG: DASH family cryptochrome [Cryomorphaceae bacterium]|nr:DASH family cryptochrome [Cryomorphaceae bacterium]
MRVVYWFRNDLRLTDNVGLSSAIANSSEVIPVYIINKSLFTSKLGVPRMGPHRMRFLLESLQDLQNGLREIGSELMVLVGDPSYAIPKITSEFEAEMVFCSSSQGTEEALILKKIRENIPVSEISDGYLLDPNNLPFNSADLPNVFTQFRIQIEKNLNIPQPIPRIQHIQTPPLSRCDVPTMEQLGLAAPVPHPKRIDDFRGGEHAGWIRLQHYCSSPERLGRYKETRNGLIGEYSSRFSAWLSIGAISARSIMKVVKEYEAVHGANDGSYWMFFELLWRDYFRLVCDKYGAKMFLRGGLKDKPSGDLNMSKFQSWCKGETACDFVNANMIELSSTGWMSNRGRQNVASFLVHEMGVDWRLGAAWFESMLVDFDVANNYGNWLYLAGVGNDPRPNRRFNTALQQAQYDPKSEYTNRWVEQK